MTPQRTLEIGPGRYAHASGGLWLPQEGIAILADVHLGYGWALRRRGQLGPVQDVTTACKLTALLDELQPRTVVFLGDLVHAPRPAPQERAMVESTLGHVNAKAQMILVRGNHDRAFSRDFSDLGLAVVDNWQGGGIIAMHGDRPVGLVDGHVVLGHLHPAVSIVDDAGAGQRIPVFLTNSRCTVVPAFSPFAAGFNLRARLPQELRTIFSPDASEVVAASGRRVVRLGSLAQVRRTR